MGRDLGDFQTPPALVAAVLARLASNGRSWQRVLEPTCGRGNFLAGVLDLDSPPGEVQGIEFQESYLSEVRHLLSERAPRIQSRLIRANLFEMDLKALTWDDPDGSLLVVGNPPWVTNSEFGALESKTRPPRSNARRVRGIDAITGNSNFDAAEAVWLKVLTELAEQAPTVALLCKTAVARNVLEHARRLAIPVEFAEVVRVDARAWFGAAVEACLLVLQVDREPIPDRETLDRVPVFADLEADAPESFLGFARGRTVANADDYRRYAWLDGECPLNWRQGVKHDAAGVMELSRLGQGLWTNKTGDVLRIEEEFVFPLLKGTDLARPAPVTPHRAVIVTQRRVGEETVRLATEAPALWTYLQSHVKTFSQRKSSVYRDRPSFAMFGIGPYTFAPYKVGVSGLHKSPIFQAVGPIDGRPVMLDDTGYFLPCRSPEQAALIATSLNGPEAIGLLASLALPGAKRPVTKGLLQRLDLKAIVARADRGSLMERAGREVERLAGHAPSWPSRLEDLLESESIFEPKAPLIQESAGTWPSPPSMTSAAL